MTESRDTIVCGIDKSDGACAAAQLAAVLARRLGLRLELLHVCRPDARPEPGVISYIQEVVQRELPDVTEVDVFVETGPVADRLADAARSAAMLVVGSRGEGAMRRTLFGSVSAAVTRAPEVPVLVLPPRANNDVMTEQLGHRGVVCGIRDRSDDTCAHAAAHLASGLGVPLTVVHVMTPPLVAAVAASDAPPLMASPAIAAPREPARPAELLADVTDSLAEPLGTPPRLRLASGAPGPELCRVATAEDAALVAVGASDRGPLTASLVGSAGWHLMRHAERPVMFCPTSGTRRRDGRASG